MPFSNCSYVDDAGVTHTNVNTYMGGEKGGYNPDAPASCLDSLPYAHEMKPNFRYTGSLTVDLPADAKTLTFSATSHDPEQEWVIEVPRNSPRSTRAASAPR